MKKISVLLTFVALFIFYGYASAQNNPGIKIEGKVVDSVAGTALQLATITLKSGNNPAQAATTKTDGTFGFSGLKAGSYNLAIKRAGYAEKDLTVAVSGNTVLKTIGLSPDVKSLKEVQVRSVRPLIQQKPGKIVAQDLDVAAVEPPGAYRAFFGAGQFLAVDIDHRHTLQMRAHRARLLEQLHFLHDFECGPANVDGLAARTRRCGTLNDRDLEAAFSKPVSEGRSGNAGAGNENLGHPT